MKARICPQRRGNSLQARVVAGDVARLAGADSLIADISAAADATPFAADRDIVIARAPGRLDVMGGIADYSGSLVLEMPLREAALVAVQERDDRKVVCISANVEADEQRQIELSMDDLAPRGNVIDYAAARALFGRDPAGDWAGYVAGNLLTLLREARLPVPASGVSLLLRSKVPEGKGVSSSAAIEVATMAALAALWDVELTPMQLANWCQITENLIVGAPCGIMDQVTCSYGQANHLTVLLCQPATIEGHVTLPKGLAVWGIDSGVRHAVSGADYGSVRVGAFMGYRIIADRVGLEVRPGTPLAVDDLRWHGYLANISPGLFAQELERHVPLELTGAEFLARYGGSTDAVTSVDPQCTYAVRVPTRHPIDEHFRVRTFRQLLARSDVAQDSEAVELLGELMYQSHASYGACGLGAAATDAIVAGVRAAGVEAGLFGAKITGGGSGGTVAVLGRADAAGAVAAVAEQHAADTGAGGTVFSGSSSGAVACGTVRFRLQADR